MNPVLAKETSVVTFIPLCLHSDLLACFHFVSCQIFEETDRNSCIGITRYIQLTDAYFK